AAVANLSDLKLKGAGIRVEELRAEISKRRMRMLELEPETGGVDEVNVTALEQKCNRLRAEIRELDEELAKARGALEQVGGAVVRERLAEVGQAIQH
ncbi:MAG TPA: hypothetical protein PKU97_22955, partial [Kofleriaceae bacterium]|nr:hypothetical protein [Kofleriaceae bacterium]